MLSTINQSIRRCMRPSRRCTRRAVRRRCSQLLAIGAVSRRVGRRMVYGALDFLFLLLLLFFLVAVAVGHGIVVGGGVLLRLLLMVHLVGVVEDMAEGGAGAGGVGGGERRAESVGERLVMLRVTCAGRVHRYSIIRLILYFIFWAKREREKEISGRIIDLR